MVCNATCFVVILANARACNATYFMVILANAAACSATCFMVSLADVGEHSKRRFSSGSTAIVFGYDGGGRG